ncbi:hypothetical protein Tco_1372070 [Tanacetum coccineum]
MSDQLAEEKNTVKIQQKTISELKDCLHKNDFENEHLKSKVVDFTTVQNLQVQVVELKSVNKSLNLSLEELYKARALAEATLRERDEMINAQLYSLVQKEYNDLLESNGVSTFETKNLELVKEIGDKVKCFDEEKKAFETHISKFEKVLAQRVKDFDDVKTELSKRTDKFETYFVNFEKENALLKSQLASQNYTSLQKENNALRTSYNVLKEKYETSCKKFEKENNDLKMHYKRLFDSIKQKKVVSHIFTQSIPKVNVSDKLYMGESSKPISKKVYQFTTYSLQKDRKYLKKQHSSETFSFQNHVKNESSKQMWKSKKNISKRFKYSRDDMFLMRKRDDSVLKKVKDVRFPFISKRTFQSETPSFNNKWKSPSSSRVKTSNEKNFKSPLIPRKLFQNETPGFNSHWKSTSIHQIDATYIWFSKYGKPVSNVLK